MINGVLIFLDSSGIIETGYAAGTNDPGLDTTSGSTTLKIHAVKLYVPVGSTVPAGSRLLMPVAFGYNKLILYVDGKAYFPEVDFTVEGNVIRWGVGQVTITDVSNVIAFGPANRYTAQAFTLEVPVMANPLIFDSATQTIRPNPPGEGTKPYNQDSIYLFLDGESYLPNIDFTYDFGNNVITWINQSIVLTVNSDIKLAYYNRVVTSPFILGDVLYRILVTADQDHQASFTIAAVPKTTLLNSSNIFYNGNRYTNLTDYTVSFFNYNINSFNPSLLIPDTGSLYSDLLTNGIVDISYFRDNLVNNLLVVLNQILVATGTSLFDPINLQPATVLIDPIKTLVFLNGLYAYGQTYDNISDITNVTLTPPTDPRIVAVEAQYILNTSNNSVVSLTWNSDDTSRTPSLVIETDDVLQLTAFADELSVASINIEYFQRDSNTSSPVFTLLSNIKQDKVIVFYNGEALFQEFDQFTTGGILNANELQINYPTEVPEIQTDEIAIMYIKDDSYSVLWKFDVIYDDNTVNAEIDAGSSTHLVLEYPLNDPNLSMLFVNGVRIPNNRYEIVTGSQGLEIALIGDVLPGFPLIPAASKVIMIYV